MNQSATALDSEAETRKDAEGREEMVGNRAAMDDLVKVETRCNGNLALITINRPQSLNSLTRSMMKDLAQIFKSLDSNEEVKVIILTGAGRAFCSGVVG